MIPKRMSFFWSGTPMSWLRYRTLYSFRKYHPDWEMCLYEPLSACVPKTWPKEEEDARDLVDYRDRLVDLGMVRSTWKPHTEGIAAAHSSDFFQWDLLGKGGGFYSDMDIVYVRDLGPEYEFVKDADALFCLEGGGMAIGFAGASPGCLVFKEIHHQAMEHYRPTAYQCTGVEAVYRAAGHWPLRRNSGYDGIASVEKFSKLFPNLRVTTIPDAAFYYWDWISYKNLYTRKEEIPGGVVGIHWFGGSAISQQWNRGLNPETAAAWDTTLGEALRRSMNA